MISTMQELAMVVALCVHFLLLTGSADFVVYPEPNSALLGGNATFSCAGKNILAIIWTIDDVNTVDLGIEPTNDVVGGVRMSNLTINGTVENNNVSIQCHLINLDSAPITSTQVLLTVLGIACIPFVKLTQTTSPLCIEWGEPVFVSADVTDLKYNVSVSGADPSPQTFTVKETKYCLKLTPCQDYSITVTPFSASHNYIGSSNTTNSTIIGDNPYLEGPCDISIEFTNSDKVTCSFNCSVISPQDPCPLQSVKIVIDSYSDGGNKAVQTHSSAYVVGDSITDSVSSLAAREKCYAEFTPIDFYGMDGNTIITNFTTYSVQLAKFRPLHSSVEVTCFFAINTTASGCWIIFINSSLGITFNGSLEHLLPQSTGLIEIPNSIVHHEAVKQFGKVVFDAKVHDVSRDGTVFNNTAYELQEALVVESVTLSPDISSSTIASSTLVIPSTTLPVDKSIVIGAVVATCTSLAVMASFLVLIILVAAYCWKKNKCGKYRTQKAQVTNSQHQPNPNGSAINSTSISHYERLAPRP